MRLQLVLVLRLELLLGNVEVESNLFIRLELHDDEWVARLALAQRGVETDAEHAMHIIGLRKHHELLDCVVLYLVVVGLATETK